MHERIRATITLLLAFAPVHLFAQPAHLVKDIFSLPAAAASNPQKFAQVGSTIFFAASDTANSTELWKTDGTTAGTMLVRDIQLGPNSSAPECLQPYQGKLIFLASEESTGTQLWQSDGTAAGTRLLVQLGASIGGATLSGCPLQIDGLLIFKVAGPQCRLPVEERWHRCRTAKFANPPPSTSACRTDWCSWGGRPFDRGELWKTMAASQERFSSRTSTPVPPAPHPRT
jgi:ELWxxDGT repeat protein